MKEQCQVCSQLREPEELRTVTDFASQPWRECKARTLDAEGRNVCASKAGPDELRSLHDLVANGVGEDNSFILVRAKWMGEGHTRLEFIANCSQVDAVRLLTRVVHRIINELPPDEKSVVLMVRTPEQLKDFVEGKPNGSKEEDLN